MLDCLPRGYFEAAIRCWMMREMIGSTRDLSSLAIPSKSVHADNAFETASSRLADVEHDQPNAETLARPAETLPLHFSSANALRSRAPCMYAQAQPPCRPHTISAAHWHPGVLNSIASTSNPFIVACRSFKRAASPLWRSSTARSCIPHTCVLGPIHQLAPGFQCLAPMECRSCVVQVPSL
ncbi:hypothetical protein PLICRDRAFT_224949 [Plicaturopsis crispa FD-325 SS-3]|nr:hypothetical protein PLICRDRAFT_224949 [Plicaturopsis crispa FD-325 SS-3]